MERSYDVVICGAGPAGLTSAIYAARGGLKTLIVEKMYAGGQTAFTYSIENYPGFLDISGAELAQKMQEQTEKLGVEFAFHEIVGYDLCAEIKTLITAGGEKIFARSVILAMGASPRKLGISGEDEFLGRGVSYCATCDGAFYKNKIVAVVGGGNTAVEDALYLKRFAKEVYIIHRRDTFRASKILVDKLRKSGVICVLDSQIEKLQGDTKMSAVFVKNVKTEELREIKIDGLFVAVGQIPNTAGLSGFVKLDETGYIIANEDMETNISNVYAVGDIRVKTLRQIVTACADGAIAVDNLLKNI